MTINIHSLVGEYCITLEDGQKVYDIVHPELRAGRAVVVDFRGTKVTTALFLNAAVGQLFEDLPAATVKRLLFVSNLGQVGRATLDLVTRNSVEYFTDLKIRAAVDTVMAEMATEQ